MATPLVAGCAAALREALIAHRINNPSAALIKALLINGANLPPTLTPNVESGFGRVNLVNSILVVCGMAGTGFCESEFGDADEELFSVPIPVESSLSNLKITLVWPDPKGDKIRNALALDVLHSDGTISQDYDPDNDDDINNVQQVVWLGMPPRNVTLYVTFWGSNDDPPKKQLFVVV